MGYLAVLPVMDGKRALGPDSSNRLINQRSIEDHMISHYKKLYSAKAAVDCSTPKSMRCHVKYTDQKRRKQIKKDAPGRSQSATSLSQRSLRLENITSCSSRNVRPSIRGAESAYFNSGDSVMSSPRVSTSFHCKQIVYPSQMTAQFQNCRPSSELSYITPKSQRHPLTPSCGTSSRQEKFKSFQSPTEKTYSGDILNKHAQFFTEEKPFTPRTLKTDYNSTLSSYRYYTPASRKGAEEKTLSKCNQPDTRCKSQQRLSMEQDLPQPCNVDYEWSEEDSNVLGHYSIENKFTGSEGFLSSLRVSPEGMKSPIMRKVTAEEEELMYLEFITDVTNEIIQRGIYSDRVLQRVFERHIDMNKHRLAEDKMRHLLEALQNDLQNPIFSPVTVLEYKKRESSLSYSRSDLSFQQTFGIFPKEDPNIMCFTHLKNEDMWGPDDIIPTLHTTPVNDNILENLRSGREEEKKEQAHEKKDTMLFSLENHHLTEEDSHQNCADNDVFDELSRNMAKSLNVSDIHSLQDDVTDQESFVKLSDDEFSV